MQQPIVVACTSLRAQTPMGHVYKANENDKTYIERGTDTASAKEAA